ncbi:hypothetical protein Angca_000114, partial [Angiostrongylus cantonensis]
VPEFDPVTCSNAFLFGEPSIEQELINVGRSDCSHIVLVPFYAHFSCAHSGFLLNEAARVLQKFTNPAFVNGKEVHYERIIPNSSNSFRYWLHILKSKSDNFDAAVFITSAITKRLADELPTGKRIAIVPISSLLPDFDTLSVLPSITQSLDKSVLIQPEGGDAVLLEGVAEGIKNHLLGRRSAQLRSRCNWCRNRHCEEMRTMLDDTNVP